MEDDLIDLNIDLNRAIEEELYNYEENHKEVCDVEDEGTSQQVMVADHCIEEETGGEDCVGHMMIDHLNYCYKLKMKQIDGKDSQTLVNKLYNLQPIDPEFFFRVRLNDEGKVECLFWRDSLMREDYKIYGDVLVFDTTFRTNKYNLICAPFLGINNHWKNTMFACAFIGDETTEYFVWVFETFLKAMGGKHPVSIFTNQDAAIAAGIEHVFPSSRHRLCLWHLSKNANSRFGLFKTDKNFKNAFYKCLSRCITPNNFEETWKSMINTFKLENDDWFNRLYGLKEKWCTTLSKDFFSAGILSSQRSESTNHVVAFKANKSTTLTEFYSIFQATINRWRKTEEKDDFDCTRGIPTSELSMSAILKQAANVYTITLFRDFEEEFKLFVDQGKKFNSKLKIQLSLAHAKTLKNLDGHNIAKTRKFIEEKFITYNKEVDEIIKKEEERKAKEEAAKIAEQEKAKAEAQRETQDGKSTNSEITIVLDPDRANTKGKSKKRIKGQYDNYKQPSRKGKKKHKEFGSKTPSIQLFTPKEQLF
ncbi:protein FAR1-RELATED SEQUENCE 5-like [Spinacia oleracea]|uniref:Protein FAR1-RELATED SEQUENCE 5-like n=1 Tax=Spinacia oleracea TaxID=3562 RepID=A0ABM3QQ62_SPIOL|nr:protein FAR1-RELATED SEQUENCE 5-like [Spinacia oleracea]